MGEGPARPRHRGRAGPANQASIRIDCGHRLPPLNSNWAPLPNVVGVEGTWIVSVAAAADVGAQAAIESTAAQAREVFTPGIYPVCVTSPPETEARLT